MKEALVKRGISFRESIYKQVEDKAFSENNGNISGTVNNILRDYFKFLAKKRQSIAQMKPNEPKAQSTLKDF